MVAPRMNLAGIQWCFRALALALASALVQVQVQARAR